LVLAKTTYQKAEKNFKIEMDSRKSEDVKNFKLSDYDIKAPNVCQNANVICHEKTSINTTLVKEWEIISVPSLSDKTLTPQEFGNYYPNLNPDQVITNSSKSQDKWIVQKILYERGLLNVFPTGKIGLQTEEAIIKLQHLKGFTEYDNKRKVVIIGPKTITALNDLKNRMKSPNYQKTGLPQISANEMSPEHQARSLEIQKALNTLPAVKANTKAPTPQINRPQNNGEVLKFSGEAQIQNTKE